MADYETRELSDKEMDNVVGGMADYLFYEKETSINPSTGKEARKVILCDLPLTEAMTLRVLKGSGFGKIQSMMTDVKERYIPPDADSLKSFGFYAMHQIGI